MTISSALPAADARESLALLRTTLDTVYASFYRNEIDLDTLLATQDQLHREIAEVKAAAGWM